MLGFARRNFGFLLVVVLLLLAAEQVVVQCSEQAYVQDLTSAVIQDAGAIATKDKVIAIRDYLRKNVAFNGAPVVGRPFLRATAAETLKSRKGYCGEVSRAFICMAGCLDIPAQRINLYGPQAHTVAEVDINGRNWIVDCQYPPPIPDLKSLEQIMLEGTYADYSTLNVRRLGLDSLFSRIKLHMGPLTYWGENPHALKAAFCGSLAGVVMLVRPLRWSVRTVLRRRGWIHKSDKPGLDVALNGHAESAPRSAGVPSA
jgi:hypothetical protein